MSMRTLVTWNSIIAGYVENGRAEDGLRLFRTMSETGVKPNALSLTSVLLGCSDLSALHLDKQVHQLVCKSLLSSDTTDGRNFVEICYVLECNDFWNLGVQYSNTMVRDFGIETKPEHYAWMVDLLDRAGKLSEAVDFIKCMPFKPHPAIYGTLLGACRINKNLQLAGFAAKFLLELDPTIATGYVQLANVYAEHKTDDHLANLEKKMKLAGYVPYLEFVLHDAGEELKEQLLLWHSEKLAIAFGLLKVLLVSLIMCGQHNAIAIELKEIQKSALNCSSITLIPIQFSSNELFEHPYIE
ncbi:Pentatricopeptide repeat-containing protein, mitochondrial [Glycine soja]